MLSSNPMPTRQPHCPEQSRTDASIAIINSKLDRFHDDMVELRDAMTKMADAVGKVVLLEERQVQAAQALERAFKAIEKLGHGQDALEKRIAELEKRSPEASRVHAWVDRAIWAAAAAGVASFLMK